MNRFVVLLGALVGVVAVIVGMFVVFGVGWALIVGGGVVTVSALLIDVKESDGEPSPASP